jgi:uncharacterized protein
MDQVTFTEKKLHLLLDILSGMDSVVVGFSGGVDSTFLLACCLRALGKEKVLAATALSETYPASQLEEAKELARSLGVEHHLFNSGELEIEGFKHNPPDRCFYCKRELYSYLKSLAEERGYQNVIDGSNVDDESDYRPGMRALEELNIRSPLREARIGKEEIRNFSREMSLPTWDKPSFACLSSRFPYGEKITRSKLSMIDEAEEYLRGIGFRQLRVRHHGDTARIEVEPHEIKRLASDEVRTMVVEKFKAIGYCYVSIDMQGYRTGSLNEVIEK